MYVFPRFIYQQTPFRFVMGNCEQFKPLDNLPGMRAIFPKLSPYMQTILLTRKPFPQKMAALEGDHLRVVVECGDNSVYEGAVNKNGIPYGFGKMLSENRLIIGNFQNGEANGEIHLIVDELFYFHGEMVHNEITCEKGNLFSERVSYEGGFNKNVFDGMGTEVTPTYSFKGSYFAGKRKEGTFIWGYDTQKSTYTGKFNENEEFTGTGLLQEPSGEYKGLFVRGMKQGSGIYRYNLGITYEGSYKEGLKNGRGKLINPDGSVFYEGEFKDGLPHGKGRVKDASGEWQKQWIQGLEEQLYNKLKSQGHLNPTNLQASIDSDDQERFRPKSSDDE